MHKMCTRIRDMCKYMYETYIYTYKTCTCKKTCISGMYKYMYQRHFIKDMQKYPTYKWAGQAAACDEAAISTCKHKQPSYLELLTYMCTSSPVI